MRRILAELYQVQTSRLNEQVKRNIERFDGDFMFQLTKEEFDNMISQNATSCWGGVRKLPYVFTEQGVYMLATVLKSGITVEVTKQIMRTFTKLKNQSVPYFDIIKRLEKLETNDKETTELPQKVVQVVSSMQRCVYVGSGYFLPPPPPPLEPPLELLFEPFSIEPSFFILDSSDCSSPFLYLFSY